LPRGIRVLSLHTYHAEWPPCAPAEYGYDGHSPACFHYHGSARADALDPVSGVRPRCVVYTYQGEEAPYIADDPTNGLQRVTSVALSGTQGLAISRTALGRPSVITYTCGNASASYTNLYDSSGEYLRQEWGPRGELVRGYGYHPVITYLLVSVTNAVGDVLRYTHDTNTMKVTSITFPSGLVRTNIYYASGPSQTSRIRGGRTRKCPQIEAPPQKVFTTRA